MYLTLTLNPSIDHYMNLPAGQVLCAGSSDGPALNRSAGEYYEAGGKGINVAKVLSRLGCEVTATGFAGGFTGAKIASDLEREGISSRFVKIAGTSRINVKVTDGNGIETEINGAGPEVSGTDVDELIGTIGDIAPDTIIISGALPGSLPSDTYASIMDASRKNHPGAKIVADCSGQAMEFCLPMKPFLIKPNLKELSELTGMPADVLSGPDRVKEAAFMLFEKGAQNVLVSRGAEGACCLTGDGAFYTVPGIKGDVVSTIGAGDTMLASFIYMLDVCGDCRKALEFANKCAALAAFARGLPAASELKALVS